MRDFPPTNERRSQGLLTHLRTVTTRALGGSTAKKYAPHTPPAAQPVQNSPNTPKKAHFSQFCTSRENFVPHPEPNPVQNSPNTPTPAAHPVQNSPSTPTPAAQPVQNSPNTYKKAHFSLFCSSRENFVPPPPPRSRAGRTLYRAQRQTRYKTLPAQPVRRPNRYKTLPTRPKRPISASFAPAGRTLYRIHPHDPQQGELCTALTITMPSRENFVPHPAPPPVQNSPNTPTPAAQPVQNSPNTPKNAHFSLFCPSRENFVPLSPSRCPAGRTLYRAQRQTRYKTLPAQPVRRPNRYKTLPTRTKRPISACFARAGRTMYRSHHHDPQQGR